METFELLKALCDADGPAGDEGRAADWAARWLAGCCGPVERTPLGSVCCTVVPPQEGRPHLLLDAHLDEVGFLVTHIDEEGFVKIAPVGGIDHRLLLSARLCILGGEEVPAVVSCLAPHLSAMEGFKKAPPLDKLYLDTGFGREELERLVAPGDRVCYRAPLRRLLGSRVTGKALDDRAGCAAVCLAAKAIKESGFDGCGVTALLSTREEVGGQGAATAAFLAAPTHCVAVDVSFALSPGCDAADCGELGAGPMIGYAPTLDRGMYQALCRTAAGAGIPFQREIMAGRTGTNADGVAVAGGGVRCVTLSIPQRYMHTPAEVCDLTDIENTAALLAAYVKGGEWSC
ncbi:M42 family metallopeptidase [Bittarella massiliensis (ex Durand et al. 2017)]|uniref:M42 family metallopeptidase n=1 Tax=Bittarella massiliensis (ex Durand et al. 2017) TaxID=1720313 RepID=UPI001AA0D8F8|nr:M20/M25/M40 family metallo-hydrolase [Bittarella massiliensis (ex Durand et al. 2017)]MBO1679879.1 M20/M25/M40 family metallo-hydrolase [Bittarella massiliensis (ex Durand et al. 2017)]